MPENTIFNIPLTASYAIPPEATDGEHAPAAFRAEAGSHTRASRSRAPGYASTASIFLPASRPQPRLTLALNAPALLRHAPARPGGIKLSVVAAFMRPCSPSDSSAASPDAHQPRRNHSVASQDSGYSATSSGYHSGYHSGDNGSDNVSDHAFGNVSHDVSHNVFDNVSDNVFDRASPVPTPPASTPGLPAAARFRTSTAAIRGAVDALIEDCVDARDAGSMQDDTLSYRDAAAKAVADAAELYALGRGVHAAMLADDKDWPRNASPAIASAATRLARGAAPTDIDMAFVQLALAFHTDNATIAQFPALDRAGRLRALDHDARQRLDAALDADPALQAAPRVRRIARRIVDVMAEIAHEAYPRRAMSALLMASERHDIGGMHGAIEHLYGMYRSSAPDDASDLDRHVLLVRLLPPAVRQQFMDTFMPMDRDAARGTPTRGIHAYLESSRANTLPGGYMSEGLRYDQRRLITDLFTTAAILRGDDANVMPYRTTSSSSAMDAAPEAAPADTPPPLAPATRVPRRDTVAGRIRRALRTAVRPSSLERAQRAIARTMKAPTGNRLGAQDAPQAYADAAQAYVRTLRPADLRALHRMTQVPDVVKIDDADARRLRAIDAAVTREFALRNDYMPAVKDVLVALRDGASPRVLADALDSLTYEMQSAGSVGVAFAFCELAVHRLDLPRQDVQAALARIHDRAALDERERDMIPLFRGHAQRRNEALRLMPALRGLAAIVRKAAPPEHGTGARAMPPRGAANDPAPEIAAVRTLDALRDMPAVQQPLAGTIARDIWRRARTISGRTWWPASASRSARLARAHRQVAVSLKQQAAASRPLTRSQWKLLESAIKDIARLQAAPARYEDVVEACVRTLSPAECVSLNHVVDSYQWLLEPAGAPAADMVEQLRHLRAMETVLGREPAIRHATRAVGKVMETLAGNRRREAELPAAIAALAACLDTYAPDAGTASMLCAKALDRLAPPARQARHLLSALDDTARAVPALQALSRALETRAAR
ncbi:hypothetical protein CAL12_11700 [Bordetella genomosp. 8]|uniref:Uncharacterized protein n=1 Tax=Bordetella genomosp. 8 TaxID=1416806 RepID=A0A1W6YJZ8_9BORD|nr:hypothetical protein [Bordetella genomosp. 8]ARP81397.1 hypothetical protein CAL12_11700 [Bordetella genomosp. 8]